MAQVTCYLLDNNKIKRKERCHKDGQQNRYNPHTRQATLKNIPNKISRILQLNSPSHPSHLKERRTDSAAHFISLEQCLANRLVLHKVSMKTENKYDHRLLYLLDLLLLSFFLKNWT